MKINLKSSLFILPFLGFMVGYATLFVMMHEQVIIIPPIVGKNVYDAMMILSSKNLGMRLAHERIDDILPEGTIIQQMPAAESSSKPNQSVFVTISKKTPLPYAPELINQTYEQIYKQLEKTSFKLKTIWLESSFPKNKCLGQYPLAGKEIVDNKVTIFVSARKSQLYVMPNFKNQNLEKVIDILQSNKIDYELFGLPRIPDALVHDQQPMAGSLVDLGKALTVHLHVSYQ